CSAYILCYFVFLTPSCYFSNSGDVLKPSSFMHLVKSMCTFGTQGSFVEDNTLDIIRSGGIKELIRISRESSREDTRNLAKKALDSNPAFSAEIHAA
ncbi:hypothetical protein GW17_00033615, partial [Ensete ventricosum]